MKTRASPGGELSGQSAADVALFSALDKDDCAGAQIALKAGANANAVGEFKRAPLHWAGESGNPDLIKLLLGAGAHPNALECAQLLLAAGAKKTFKSENGSTPLAICARMGSVDLARLVFEPEALELRARTDGSGGSCYPLHAAAAVGKKEMCQFLLEAGADALLKDGSGKSPLEVAKENSQSPAAPNREPSAAWKEFLAFLKSADEKARLGNALGSGHKPQAKKARI